MNDKKEPRLTKSQIEIINGRLVQRGPVSPLYRTSTLSKTMQVRGVLDSELQDTTLRTVPLEEPSPKPRKSFHSWQDRLPDDSPYKPKPKKKNKKGEEI